jgi:hypothetical protein
MTDEREDSVKIIEAHQDLVAHLERSTGRMRALSLVTVIIAVVLALAYASQLALGLTGTTTVTVNLADPANETVEAIVLALTVLWLYVGLSDFLFSTRVRMVIARARTAEKELEKRLPPTSSGQD